jgi:hypothetical protein
MSGENRRGGGGREPLTSPCAEDGQSESNLLPGDTARNPERTSPNLDDLRRAWRSLYRTNLDALPDAEIAWERNLWHAVGLEELVAICDALLSERHQFATGIPGGADADALTHLLRRVESGPAVRLVEHEALPLVEAARLVYWSGLQREVGR